MIKIAICDDDERIVNKIKQYIESYKQEMFNICTFNSGEELLEKKKVLKLYF